jgi:hypothetical protein
MEKKQTKNANPQSKGVGFAFVSIATKQFAIIPENYKATNINKYVATTDFMLDEEQKIIEVLLEISLKQRKGVFMICQIACYFSIEQDAWDSFLRPNDNAIVFPKDFATHLVVLAIGTIRGILYAKTEDTVLNGFVLSTLNVTKIVKKDVIFTLE